MSSSTSGPNKKECASFSHSVETLWCNWCDYTKKFDWLMHIMWNTTIQRTHTHTPSTSYVSLSFDGCIIPVWLRKTVKPYQKKKTVQVLNLQGTNDMNITSLPRVNVHKFNSLYTCKVTSFTLYCASIVSAASALTELETSA